MLMVHLLVLNNGLEMSHHMVMVHVILLCCLVVVLALRQRDLNVNALIWLLVPRLFTLLG
jgi:hypothetical protein